MTTRIAVHALVVTGLVLLLTVPVLAEWDAGGVSMYSPGPPPETLYDNIVYDGSGGCYVVWEDVRDIPGRDLYLQHLDVDGILRFDAHGYSVRLGFGLTTTNSRALLGSAGNLLIAGEVADVLGNNRVYVNRIAPSGDKGWSDYGVSVCITNQAQTYPELITDGENGALVIWKDDRDGDGDIYAQRVDSTGSRVWGDGGVAICTHGFEKYYHRIIADGNGGAIIVWRDGRNSDLDVYAQRIDENGLVQWAADGVVVCNASGDQDTPAVQSDGAGGAIIVWEDGRNASTDIYAQRINGSGTPVWTPNGIPACNDAAEQSLPAITTGSDGKSFITWIDARNGDADVYANRISIDGVVGWTLQGTVICTDTDGANDVTIVGDGDGGAILTWRDLRGTEMEIYAQRVNHLGVLQWPSPGLAVCTETGMQFGPRISTDGSGGAFITWLDERDAQRDVYAQKVSAAGTAGWEPDGISVCTEGGEFRYPQIVSDGEGGAIVSWEDDRSGDYDVVARRVDANGETMWPINDSSFGTTRYDEKNAVLIPDGEGGTIMAWESDGDIRAQRLDATGSPLWWISSEIVCGEAGTQSRPAISPDGSGGAIILWQDDRGGDDDIYAQRLDEDGRSVWTAGGIPVCSAAGNQAGVKVIPDGTGGAIAAWYDSRVAYCDLYTQRIDASGTAQWTAGGTGVCTHAEDIVRFSLDSDGAAGAIFAWEDMRSPSDCNIYAQRVDAAGTVQWTADGNPVSIDPGTQLWPKVLADGLGGALIVWTSNRAGDYDINGINIDSAGNLFMGGLPVPICSATGDQYFLQIISDGGTMAYIAWEDTRNGNSDIYAQLIDLYGNRQWFDDLQVCGDASEQAGPWLATDEDGGAVVAWSDARNGAKEIYTQRITSAGLGPICDLSRTEIDYSPVEPTQVGSTVATSLMITNMGQSVLIGNVSESSDHFFINVGEGPFALEAGENLIVGIVYAPESAGVHEGTLFTGTYLCGEVPLSGEAYECPPDSVVYVDSDATGAGTGTSWADALTDLQEGLFIAGHCLEADQVWVAEGTYMPTDGTDRGISFELQSGLAVYGGFAGGETALSQRDPGTNVTVLSGDIGTGANTDNSYHVVTAVLVDSTAVLDGFTVTGGYADGSGNRDGAGIYMEGSGGRIANVRFEDNYAQDEGGGAYIRPGTADFFNCVFTGNSAENGGGMVSVDHTGRIVNCTFVSNTASVMAGGIFFAQLSLVEVVNTIVWGNAAPSEPEIYNLTGDATVTFSYSCLYGCGVTGGQWNKDYGIDGGNNIDTDPLYVDEPAGDIRLLDGTPCENTGNISVPGLPEIDIAGAARIQDGTIDMGAYEGGVDRATVTVATEPHDFYIRVDGAATYSPHSFQTDVGAEHEIGIFLTPQTRNDTIFHFMGWSDGGDTIHSVVIPESPVTYTAYFSPLAEHAAIDSIVDVPGDQGGYARVYFSRSMYDHVWETVNPIERYNVHRRVDSPALAAEIIEDGKTVEQDLRIGLSGGKEMVLCPSFLGDDSRYVEFEGRFFIVADRVFETAPPGVWEVVGDVSAQQENQYICLVSTLGDSSVTIPWSVYYVSAHTTTPALFYDSEPDSGYSVDNIAPGVPQNLSVAYNTGSGNQLGWDACADEDFQYFRIYRDTDPEFVPGPGSAVHATTEISWTDTEYDGWNVYYKVTALDHAGNESVPAEAGTTTGSETPEIPDSYALYQNVPNPFNPVTTIRFDLPRAGYVKLAVYNVKGQLVSTLIGEQMDEGRKEVRWNGLDDRGNRAASGIYFYRLMTGDYAHTRKMVLLR